MLVTVVATFCQLAAPSACVDEVITNEATLMQCGGAFAQGAISKWMSENIRYRTGWRLEKWGCAIGRQARVNA
jgi:hypothetical protein